MVFWRFLKSFVHEASFLFQVCVQGSMGEGALAGMPLQLAGTRKILEYMDWGDDATLGTFVKLGAIGNIRNWVYFST